MTQVHAHVKKLKGGSMEAFNQLFEAYSHRIYGFGLKYLKSEADAEELVQDVFLKLWRNRQKLKEEESFHSYLFTIAFNQIKDYFRYKGIYLDVEDNSLIGTSDNSTEMTITYRSVLEQVSTLLEKLPQKKKEIFRLSRFEGKSAKEIAGLMDVSPKTVDNQISEVIGFLRKNLKDATPLVWLFFYLFLQ
ncbi:RNA polymerase sigma factor [Marinilabilia rubra]|uniref:RNA polymerase sigma-70 factor n=1 Tax=Marinilabilia rubra TaxID=2162893 RepID=A0A2U2B712_9BACT|nr:RNA polymerase sigma-70 factor [Marinilabilia rubra]PWD98869.1 RNA polymerase sigma-70 factor [Marinilabilia rubra]